VYFFFRASFRPRRPRPRLRKTDALSYFSFPGPTREVLVDRSKGSESVSFFYPENLLLPRLTQRAQIYAHLPPPGPRFCPSIFIEGGPSGSRETALTRISPPIRGTLYGNSLLFFKSQRYSRKGFLPDPFTLHRGVLRGSNPYSPTDLIARLSLLSLFRVFEWKR